MKIVKAEPSQHRQGRWLVWLEDGSMLRVGEGDVVSLCLYAGKELDEREGEAVLAAARRSRLNERAVELLSARAMSRKELVEKLSTPPRRRARADGESREVSSGEEPLRRESLRADAEAVADRMERLGLLDDREYGLSVARHYRAKGFGEGRVREELYRRGVPREYWDEALSGQPEQEEDGGSRLDELVRKKLRGAQPTREELKKVSGYLARRGFGWEEISGALERYVQQAEDGCDRASPRENAENREN